MIGCASKPIPYWQTEGFGHVENYKIKYLRGEDQIAESHYAKALEEIKRSGNLKLISRIYLTKYALKTASLEDPVEGEYADIEAVEPDAENRNFFVFLKGNLAVVDAALLPERYRPFLKAGVQGKQKEINGAIADIDDPLSKIIAVGIAVKNNLYNEVTLQRAIETASINGWQKPLLACLAKLQKYYEARNEKEKAVKIQQKIKAIKN